MKEFLILTKKKNEIVDITAEVEKFCKNIEEGVAVIYCPHATCAITINENHDPNVCIDVLDCLKKLIPDGKWLHDKVDNNASAHIKASIMGPSETIPIKDGKLQLGTWQNIFLCDFDGPRERKVLVYINST